MDSAGSSRAVPGFLISVPELQDPNFYRSVVLMVEHNDEGAMGFVINRLSEATVRELCADQGIATSNEDAIRVGGPVGQERIWVLHDKSTGLEDQVRVADGIWLSFTLPSLEQVTRMRGRFILLAGYAGWGPGQLEREMEEGAWLPFPVDRNLVFDDEPETLWERLIVRFGNLGGRSSDIN